MGNIEVQIHQNLALSMDDLFDGVGVVCGSSQLLNLWSIDLFIFGGDEEASTSNKLEVFPVDISPDC